MNIYLYRNEIEEGPFSEDQLREMFARSEVTESDWARTDGGAEWMPLASLVTLATPTASSPAAVVPAQPGRRKRIWLIPTRVTVVMLLLAGVIMSFISKTRACHELF